MHFIVAVIGFLVFALIWSESRRARQVYTMKLRHVMSLYRLKDQVAVSLPATAGELVCAAIDEEIGEAV